MKIKKIFIPVAILLIVFLSIRIDTITNTINYDVNIRSHPNPKSNLVKVFKKGDEYKVLDTKSGWARIIIDNEQYYTYREDLIINSIRIYPFKTGFPLKLSYEASPDFIFSEDITIFNFTIRKIWIQLIIIISIIFLSLKKKSKKYPKEYKKEKVKIHHQEDKEVQKISNKEKGEMFEAYIVEKFNKKYYRLMDWTSDKITFNGTYAKSNLKPDLTIQEIKSGTFFYVECKYRSKDNIFIMEQQLKRYRAYGASQKNVFIIIGTGGTPNEPENLYIIPTYVTKGIKDLNVLKAKYKKADINKGFYFDTGSKRLR